ncbi:DUF5789 family protein [Haloprofundus salilacus]|uniref:DUF5789 family protein n=1 Tax=Haloprofundus salilacus TaxID=2876190 RepID=UPI001CCD7BC6|nr:hypothetical protein [Haloprofundus salilacus]
MADTKKSRDKQADDEERRQRERELEEARSRADEAEPADEAGERLDDLDDALENHEYPTTTDDLRDAFGDREVETEEGWRSVDELLIPVDDETYTSADDVRSRIQGLVDR